MSEPSITLTRLEFVALIQKIQDLALHGAFIYFPGMKTARDEPKIYPAPRPVSRPLPDITRLYKPRTSTLRWSDEKLLELMEKYNAGIPTRLLAREYGISRGHVYTQIGEAKLILLKRNAA